MEMNYAGFLKQFVRTFDNFPKPGIAFKDIIPILTNPDAFSISIKAMDDQYRDVEFDSIGAFDARGFIFGAPLAMYQHKPFFPIRKTGKLPGPTASESYSLEYGNNVVEIQRDSVKPGDKVLLIDDLLATGGTMKAGCNLVERLGGEVLACQVVIELEDLKGRELLQGYDVRSIIKY